jgi:hypothetical protein
MQLYPEVIDASQIIPKPSANIFLPIAIEGLADEAGTAVVGVVYVIQREDSSATAFGAASTMHKLVKAVLDRGAGPVVAVASAKGATPPTLANRQAAWEKLESDETVRIRLTDSLVQSDHAALGVSCKNADLIYNKQFCIVGMAPGTAKSAYIAAADSIAADAAGSKRCVLVAPALYDENGAIQSGTFTAAVVAAELAKNPDPANDLDLWPLQRVTSIERGSDGLPVFRRKVSAGVATNEFEELLQGGVSPLSPARGIVQGVQTTHLRMVFKADTSFDNLATRIIIDQVFLDVKEYIYAGGFFREPNTALTRGRIASGVEAILNERSAWVAPVTQPDGTQGYNVTVTSSADQRQVIVAYEGVVVRGINTVRVSAQLYIPI